MKKIMALVLALTVVMSCLCINVGAETYTETTFNTSYAVAYTAEDGETVRAVEDSANRYYLLMPCLAAPNAKLEIENRYAIEDGVWADIMIVPFGETPETATHIR